MQQRGAQVIDKWQVLILNFFLILIHFVVQEKKNLLSQLQKKSITRQHWSRLKATLRLTTMYQMFPSVLECSQMFPNAPT